MVPKKQLKILLELEEYLKIKQLKYIMDLINVWKDYFHLIDLK